MNAKLQIGTLGLKLVTAGVFLAASNVMSATPAIGGAYWDGLRQPGYLEAAAAAETRTACANAYGRDAKGWFAG